MSVWPIIEEWSVVNVKGTDQYIQRSFAFNLVSNVAQTWFLGIIEKHIFIIHLSSKICGKFVNVSSETLVVKFKAANCTFLSEWEKKSYC